MIKNNARQGLSTHNLYLETILRYSFGVIGLDQDKKIQFINSIISKILDIENEQQFVGQLYDSIIKKNSHLEPLFFIIQDRFNQEGSEWSAEIEVTLPNKCVLLSCQGAALDVSDTSIRFSVQSIGINTLSNRMKDLFQAAGILLENRNITSHPGKVTCCITRFNARFSDSSVKPRSGHRSRAVRCMRYSVYISEVAVLSVSDAVLVGFGGCSA
jgi:hypothetical protein